MLGLCLLAWAAFVLRAYFFHFAVSWAHLRNAAEALFPSPVPAGLDALFRAGSRLAAAGWIALAAWGAGWLAFKPWEPEPTERFEAAALRFSLGLGVLSYMVLGLGAAGLLHPWLIRAVLAGLGLAGLWRLGACSPAPALSPSQEPGLGRGWSLVLACMLAAACAVLVPFVLAPETFWDAMVYHLGLPHLYLLEGRMLATPSNIYSGNVLSMQMIFTLGLAVEGPVTAKLVNVLMGLACGLFFASWAKRWSRPGAGLLAAVLFFLCPLVFYESFRTSVGLGWALFQLACFHCVLTAASEPGSSGKRLRWWALAGVFLGLTMSTKYPAWVLPLALVLAGALSRLKSLGLPAIRVRELCLALAAAVTLLAPWVIRNTVFYKDPVFPYLTEGYAPGCELPPRDDKGWRNLDKDARSRDVRHALTSLSGFGRYALHPWTFSTDLSNVHSDNMGPLFLILLPLLFFGLTGPCRLLAVLLLGAWIPLSLLSEMPRFLMPQLAVLSFLLAHSVLGLGSGLLKSGLLSVISGVSCWVFLMAMYPPPDARVFWDVATGRVSEPRFLSNTVDGLYPGASYSAVRFINETAPKDSRVLLVGDSRGLYLKRRFLANTRFDTDIMERLANCGKGPDSIRARLEEDSVTHILVNRGELRRLRQALRFTPEGAKAFEAFWRESTEKVFEDFSPPDHWVAVFRVLGQGEKPDLAKSDDLYGSEAGP